MNSLVVNSQFLFSENYFLKGISNRLSIVLSQSVEDTLLSLASLIAVEKSVVSLIAISLWCIFCLCAIEGTLSFGVLWL